MTAKPIPLHPESVMALVKAANASGLSDEQIGRLIVRMLPEALVPSWEASWSPSPQSDGWRLHALPCGSLAGPDHGGLTAGELPWSDDDFEDGPSESMIRRAIDIARPRRMPHKPPVERRQHRGRRDPIAIGLPGGVKLRVEARALVLDRKDADVSRQAHVERPLHRGRFEQDVGCEAGDLRDRVHAGVRPTRAHDRRSAPAAAGDGLKGLFDHLLDGDPVLLPLPANVVGSVVGKGQLQGTHGDSRVRPS